MRSLSVENLETENAELREILGRIGDAIIGCDLEETITYFNPAAEKQYGLTSAEAVGQKLSAVLKYAWFSAQEETEARKALAEKGEWHGQNIHFTLDGRKLVVDSRVRLLKDAQNRPKGFLAVIRDVTAIKRNEAELVERDQRLRMHIQNSPLAVIEWDKDFRVLRWAGQAETMFGWSAQEAAGRHFSEFNLVYHEDYLHVEQVSKALSCGKTRNLTVSNRNLTKDGRVIHCMWYNSVVVDSRGEIQSIFSLVQDVTAQARAEQALKASEEIYRLVAKSSQTGFWDWDLVSGDVQYSSIYKKQLGYEDHEISPGMGEFKRLCHPDDLQPVVDKLLAAQADPSKTFNTELRMRHKNGSWSWIWCQAIVIRDKANKPVRMIGTHIDLTERKKNEEHIQKLNEQLEHRVVKRTQELKTAVDTLEKEITARRRLEREVLETSEREQSRLGQDLHDDLGQQLAGIRMLAQVLGAKLQTQKHPDASDAAELSVLCRSALDTTRNLARSFYPVELRKLGLQIAIEELANRTEAMTGTVCKTKFSSRFSPRREVAIHLYRVVQEAITNAIKHGKARNIRIEGTVRDGLFKLTVTDDGIGFKPKKTSRGLGLHIFQYRARSIGAKIDVKQVHERGGCRVTCQLPIPPSKPRLSAK